VTVSGYTLLIVESPTVAGRLQPILPQNVVVIPTNGFLWTPHFDQQKMRLGKRAIPEKRDLRREIKRESSLAIKTILATDSDPSGDFIAWSIARSNPSIQMYIAPLHSISKRAVQTLIQTDRTVDSDQLHLKLQNRYILQENWNQIYPNLNIKTAATAALFGTDQSCSKFRSKDGHLFRSDRPLRLQTDSVVKLTSESEHTHYIHPKPLSTFDAVEGIFDRIGALSYQMAQLQLYDLFTTENPQTGEGLISYPRTDTNTFFSETWDELQMQWNSKKRDSEFLPLVLRKSLTGSEVHEAIRPLYIDAEPGYICKHIHKISGQIYAEIFVRSMDAIKIPKSAPISFFSKQTGRYFTPQTNEFKRMPDTLYPVVLRSEYGKLLNGYGVLRPSGFGKWLDRALSENIIQLNRSNDVQPGSRLLPFLSKGDQLHQKLTQLSRITDDPELKSETIRQILTS